MLGRVTRSVMVTLPEPRRRIQRHTHVVRTARALSVCCAMAIFVASCGTSSRGSTAATVKPASASSSTSSTLATKTSGSPEIRLGFPPSPPPCPTNLTTPTWNDTFCGPKPPPGNGFGPSGECTGRENAPPCGPGMIPGRYYAYTLPGRCDGRLIFGGKRWRSELPPPMPVPDMYVWMRIDANGRTAGFISPNGSVTIEPDTGQPASVCTTNTTPTILTTGPGAFPGPTG